MTNSDAERILKYATFQMAASPAISASGVHVRKVRISVQFIIYLYCGHLNISN